MALLLPIPLYFFILARRQNSPQYLYEALLIALKFDFNGVVRLEWLDGIDTSSRAKNRLF